MPRFESFTTLAARGTALADATRPLALLLPRLVFGWSFHETGRGKLQNFDNTVQFFTQLDIPAPAVNAAFVSTLEAVGGLALMLGLATRPVAALLSSTMVVALLTADRSAFVNALSGSGTLTDVVPLVYLMALAILVAFGAGALSVDRLVARCLGARLSNSPKSSKSPQQATLTPAPR